MRPRPGFPGSAVCAGLLCARGSARTGQRWSQELFLEYGGFGYFYWRLRPAFQAGIMGNSFLGERCRGGLLSCRPALECLAVGRGGGCGAYAMVAMSVQAEAHCCIASDKVLFGARPCMKGKSGARVSATGVKTQHSLPGMEATSGGALVGV